MDQLRAMRVFARVIDEGSFAGAARALDLADLAQLFEPMFVREVKLRRREEGNRRHRFPSVGTAR